MTIHHNNSPHIEAAILDAFRQRYEEYITSVSPAEMALSWQALEAIWRVLVEKRPSTVLEYGSGISTALLALYGSRSECRVRSYDSDEGWARATSAFLDRMGLGDWMTCEFVAAGFFRGIGALYHLGLR